MREARKVVSDALNKTMLISALLILPVLGSQFVISVVPESAWINFGVAYGQITSGALQPNPEPIQPRRVPAQGTRLSKELEKILEFLEPSEESGLEPNYDRALNIINELLPDIEEFNSSEKALIYQLLASVYFNKENMPKTIESFENVLKQSPGFAVATEAQITYTLAQLYLQEDRPAKAVDFLKRWSKLTNRISPDQYFFAAQTFYANDDVEGAEANALEAVRLYNENGQVPKEEWLSFLRAIYFFQEDYESTLDVVIQLVRHYPKISYWKQLASLYYELGRFDDYYQALDTVYVMGGLDKESELVSLAGYFLDQNAPYKAAKIVDKGINEDKIIEPSMRNLELLANSWRLAEERDKALKEMQRAAAKSEDGSLSYVMARLMFSEGHMDDAAEALRNALKKGGLSRPDEVYITLGQVEVERDNFDAARKAFDAAAKDERSRRIANQWKQYVDTEEKRHKLLEEFL